MNNRIKKLRKQIPLDIRIRVAIQSFFINKLGGSLFLPIDEQSDEYKVIRDVNNLAFTEAQPLVDDVTECIDVWLKDMSERFPNDSDLGLELRKLVTQ